MYRYHMYRAQNSNDTKEYTINRSLSQPTFSLPDQLPLSWGNLCNQVFYESRHKFYAMNSHTHMCEVMFVNI